MATSFSGGGGLREIPTMGKRLYKLYFPVNNGDIVFY
jgi:hypothetical protein